MTDTVFSNPEGGQQQDASQPQEGAAPQAQESNVSQNVDPNSLFANQLAGIKTNDGRQKYADVSTALDSIPHAQNHIAELTRKNEELQEQLNQRAGMEQVLERIESTKQTNTEQPSVNSLSEADVMGLLNQALTQKEAADKAKTNEAAVTEALVTKFGDRDKAVEQLTNKATELGVDVGFLQSMAQHSPAAVLKYFDAAPTPTANPTTGGVNTEALNANITPTADPLAEAKAKLFGQSDTLVNKWREAAPSTN